MRQASKILPIFACFLLTASCADGSNPLDPNKKHDVIDPDRGLTRNDFENLHNLETLTSDPAVTANVLEPPIPDLAEILAAPRPPKIAQTKLVSVAVTDDVPLKDVLIELARLADVDIEVDAGITGGIAFRAKDRPFNEVIERIADLAGLRYKVKNNVLRVERDTPYVQTYALDMLNINRSAQGNIGVNSSGGGSGGSSGGSSSSSSSSGGSGSSASSSSSGGGTSTGSSSTINASSEADFWAKFEDGVKNILSYKPSSLVSVTSVATQPAAPSPAAPADPNNPAPPPATAPAPVAASETGNSNTGGTFYTLNRQAGTLTVSATERQHDIIKRFVNAIESNASTQVLIEAKIVEVALNDRYQTGINWSELGTKSFRLSGDLDAVTSTDSSRAPATITVLKHDALRVLGDGVDLSAAVKLLQEFGTTRALSSPRLNAINNQQAVLSFVENVLYFRIECKVTDAVAGTGGSTGTPAKVDVTTKDETKPIGIVMALQPSINKDTNEITMSIRPTLTRITKLVADPGFELCKAQAASTLDPSSPLLDTLQNVESKFPQVETRELDSILKVQSGQIMVIGGLLEDKITNTDAGVPGVSEVPYFGNFFKSVDKSNVKKELVILMRATVVSPHGYVDQADKAIYQKFIQDPRPLEFDAQ